MADRVLPSRIWVCLHWRMIGEQGGMCHEGIASEDSPHDPDELGCGWFVREV